MRDRARPPRRSRAPRRSSARLAAALALCAPLVLLHPAAAEPPGQEAKAPELGRTIPLDGMTGLDGAPAAVPSDAAATVLLFTRTDCPISNRYAPEMRRLHERLAPEGVAFFLVYADPAEAPGTIREQREAYGYPFAALRDPGQRVTRRTGATVTPEAAVLDAAGRLVYRGRIDDRWADFGKPRPRARSHDLADVLDALVAGRGVEPRATRAVGCYIPRIEAPAGPAEGGGG